MAPSSIMRTSSMRFFLRFLHEMFNDDISTYIAVVYIFILFFFDNPLWCLVPDTHGKIAFTKIANSEKVFAKLRG